MNTAEALKHSKTSLKLPSLPPVVMELNQMMSDPDVSVMEIGATLTEDPELSTRVLRIANSALFGLPMPVLDPSHAASILGLNRLNEIVMQAATTGAFGSKKNNKDPLFKAHWKHSILVANIARDMGARTKAEGLMAPEELHVAGLLHDAGRAILLDNLREPYLAALEKARESGSDPIEAEREAFGCNHAQLGAKLVLSWDLPRSLAQTIAFHHDPWKVAKAIPSAVLISVADRLAHAVEANDLEGMPHVARRKDLFFLGIGMGPMLSVATRAIRSWRRIEL
jgi:putative nucleotidyltransferase with HDIG domain